MRKSENTGSPLKVLVTGATGFVGGHLSIGLACAGYRVIAVGGQKDFHPLIRSAALACVSLDITDSESVKRLIDLHQPDAIVHAAAVARAEYCEENPQIARKVNVTGTANLCRAVLTQNQQLPFIFISTDLVFDGGEAPAGGFKETDAPCPRSVYAKTKHEAETIVLQEMPHGIVARVALVYGSPLGAATGFMGWLLQNLRNSQPTKLFIDEWRTPIFAPDIARAAVKLLERPQNRDRVFHLAGPERISRYEFGCSVCDVFKFNKGLLVPIQQREISSKYERPKDASLSTKKFCDDLQFSVTACSSALTLMALDSNNQLGSFEMVQTKDF